ncbi:MAG TPA: arginine deiminase family protein [Pyrinomonadaceae bacterium]|nr:arginine deiminase family protein [Pyrinomonadaceae bacterium]
MFTKAIVRQPSENFADGLTSVDLGVPDVDRALGQHRAYCEALLRFGLELIELEPDAEFPDSTFVEDTAIVTDRCAVVTRPGAASRTCETVSIAAALAPYYDKLSRIEPPGTVDGGDVCQLDEHFLIGISDRTNQDGARQLAELLAAAGYTSRNVDIRGLDGLLHLKSGISYLGDGRVLVTEALAGEKGIEQFEMVRVPNGEEYAANCVLVNGCILFANGFPRTKSMLAELGYQIIDLEMSEFRKMDGGLSCLSLRF